MFLEGIERAEEGKCFRRKEEREIAPGKKNAVRSRRDEVKENNNGLDALERMESKEIKNKANRWKEVGAE